MSMASSVNNLLPAIVDIDEMMLDDEDDESLEGPDRSQTKEAIAQYARELLCDDDFTSQNAVSQLKDMVLSTNQHQRFHQDCIGESDAALSGLFFTARTGNPTTQYHSCLTLAQLAWSHDQNSTRIPEVPGAADVLAEVLLTSTSDRAKEYAAVAIGNCGANSPSSAENFVRHEGLVQALMTVIRQKQTSRMQETAALSLKNCCSNGETAAFTVARNEELLATILDLAQNEENARLRSMGLGTINCLSRSYRAVPILRRFNVVESVLWPSMEVATEDGHELNQLTITCAIVNLSASQDDERVFIKWAQTSPGMKCMFNLVRCLGLALNNGRWHNVSFSLHSVMYPLHNLLRLCPTASSVLLQHYCVEYLEQLIRGGATGTADMDSLELSIKASQYLSRDPAAQHRMRTVGMVTSLRDTSEALSARGQAWRLQPEEQAAGHRVVAQASALVEALLEPLAALAMSQHRRLGAGSMLRWLDVDCLQLVADHAFYEQPPRCVTS